MDNKLKVKEKLELAEYLALVDLIAEGYFDSAGEYQPQWGDLNAIRLFYNFCCSKDAPINSLVEEKMKSILNDKEVIMEYYDEISNTAEIETYLTFGNAYSKALNIVEQKKSSIGTAINVITSAIKDMTEGVQTYMTKENLQYLSTIAKEIGTGKVSTDAIVETYLKQQKVNSK